MGGAIQRRTHARTAHIFAIAVILLAGALSAVWAFVVPIFQAPDEPAHFDYAVSIFSAERLIRASDGPTGWIVSPYTHYLMRAVDFDRIMEHSSMRVPKGYGTPRYFRRLNAAAPPLDLSRRTPRLISYLVSVYPFAFYGLEAAWMRLIADSTGSLLVMFFSARLLCTLLMMIGLYFNYRTAASLGVRPLLAVGLTAAVGFLPLTTFVSSYVQPDNLAFALVAVTLFLCTELLRRRIRAGVIALIGLTLGVLAVTKYQFYVTVAIPVVIYVLVRLWRARTTRLHAIAVTSGTILPSLTLLALQGWISFDPVTRPSVSVFAPFLSVLKMRHGLAVAYAGHTIIRAFVDYFISGGNAATYWGVLGWVDTPLVIVDANAEEAIRIAIALLSVATFAAVAFVTIRNASRLVRLGTRRHAGSAFLLATGDAVFNSYACFVLLMLALYVVTNNAFGAEGRQWYPYVFSAFLCFVWYAPKAFPTFRKAISTCATCVLVTYSITSSAYATSDVLRRYYGPQEASYVARNLPQRAVVQGSALGELWPVDSAEYHLAARTPPKAFVRGARLMVEGVVVFPKQRAPSKVIVVLDGRVPLPTLSGQYNYFAAEAARNVELGYGGFAALIDTAGLRPGVHTVSAYVGAASDGRYERILPARTFIIVSRGHRRGDLRIDELSSPLG